MIRCFRRRRLSGDVLSIPAFAVPTPTNPKLDEKFRQCREWMREQGITEMLPPVDQEQPL